MTSNVSSTKKKGKQIFKKKTKSTDGEKVLETIAKELAEFDASSAVKFDQYPLSTETKRGLKFANYERPTPIQKQALYQALLGRDILGAAKTGSGKTLAFIIPVLEKLYKQKWSKTDGLGALIISPTRELASQIYEVLNTVGKFHNFQIQLIVGGNGAKCVQKEGDLVLRSNIIVCTPGRMLQHLECTFGFNVDDLQILVLDEADRLVDPQFQEQVIAIVESLPNGRQVLLFSATQSKAVNNLKLKLEDPVFVSPDESGEKSTPDTLKECYTVCELPKKLDFLWSFIKNHLRKKVLIFLSTCKQVRYVYELFCKMRPGIPLLRLHRARKQHQRFETYKQFCGKKFAVLFATNIAARGLDFSSVHWVVQLDCPCDAVTYIHRVGRTARNEKKGNSLLVLLPSEEEAMVEELKKKKVEIQRVQVNPKEISVIIPRIQALCVRDSELKDFAKMAFLSYVKDIVKMSNKKIFDYSKLPLDEFAQSLGLHSAPKMRFIARKQKLQKHSEVSDDSDNSSGESDKESAEESKPALGLFPFIGDEKLDGSDDEFLKLKRPLPVLDSNAWEPITVPKLKPITKVALIKKQLKKANKPTIIAFDDNGEMVVADSEAVSNDPSLDKLDGEADWKLYKERLARERELKKQKQKKRKRDESGNIRDRVGVQLKMEEEDTDDENADDDEPDKKEQKQFKKKLTKNIKKQRQDKEELSDVDHMTEPIAKKMKSEIISDKDNSFSWLI